MFSWNLVQIGVDQQIIKTDKKVLQNLPTAAKQIISWNNARSADYNFLKQAHALSMPAFGKLCNFHFNY